MRGEKPRRLVAAVAGLPPNVLATIAAAEEDAGFFFFLSLSLSLYLPRAGAGGEQRTRRQVRASHASRLLLERALTSNYKWLVQRMKLPRPPY